MKVTISSTQAELEKLAKLMMLTENYNEGRFIDLCEEDAVAVVNILKMKNIEFDCVVTTDDD